MTAEPATTGPSGDNARHREPRGDIADRRVLEMIPGRLWAIHDSGMLHHGGPRITFHYSEESARHHYETGRAR